jgi:tetratricopeptide (TPR) repeat protein/transglutaminase-like putative cysteine protease
MCHRHLAVLFGFIFAGISLAQEASQSAPKSDTSQEAVVFDEISNRIRFETNGTGERVTTAVILVQSEAAVQEFGQLVFGYNSGSETLAVDYVRVRKSGGETITTPAASAQDFAPEVLKAAPMYSDYREKHVSVAGLRPGDVLEYQTTTHVTSAMVPGEFWYEYTFPKNAAVNEDRLEIDIPKSRTVHLKSPDRHFETRETADRRIYTWVVRDIVPDRKPRRESLASERDEFTIDVQLTTFTDWQQLAHWYAKLQGQQVVVNDEIKKKADELTKGAATPAEKAQRLYDFVGRNIRYVSISLGIGRYQPHTSVEVLENGYGDCKDKHTLLAALLSAAGIQSYPVLIHHELKLDNEVPSPAQFDHVITAARLGKDFTWLDSTAEVAPFGLIMYPLRNKQALLAAEDSNAGLYRTPGEVPVKNTESFVVDGKFSETGALDATVDLTATGDSDLPLRMSFRRLAQPDWQRVVEYVSRAFALPGDVSEISISSLEDTSKPFHLHYRIHQDGYFAVPGRANRAVPLPTAAVGGDTRNHKPSEPIDVGPAVDLTYRARLEFAANYDVRPPLPVRIARDYGEYSSSYGLTKNVLQAERHLVLKVNELPASRKSDLESMRSVLRQDAIQTMTCVISPASHAAEAAAASKAGGMPEDLMKAGNGALQRRDFKTASELFKRVVDQDPKYEEAWDSLGRAYAGLNHHEEAIKAFQKQIEIDPYSQKAHRELAEEFEQSGKNDEAIAAYRKHLEIVPLDSSAHKGLGLLLASLKRDDEARSELEAAARISPDDSEVKLALAQVYTRTGDAEKARALTKGVTGSEAASSADDMFSAALRDDADPNQSSQDARRALDDIGDHFDSGDYDQLNASVFSAMRFVALAWARIGWADFLRQENMAAMQFLESSWLLSRSGTVANRLARLYEAESQPDKARHMFALAVAAGGAETQKSNAELLKLSASPAAAQQELAQAAADLRQARSVKLPAVGPAIGKPGASAQFNLVFDGSNKPERAQFVSGDESLRAADEALMKAVYPVKFPDVSSIKVVHRGTLSCTASECSMMLAPVESSSR